MPYGKLRYDPAYYSRNLIWQYWKVQKGFEFPDYVTLAQLQERYEAFARGLEVYPEMVSADCLYDREVAYTSYFDKKVRAAVTDSELVARAAAESCVTDMLGVLESRVRLVGSFYRKVEGVGYTYHYQDEHRDALHYTSPEIEQYIERWITDLKEIESDVVDEKVAKHVDYTGCAFIERMLDQQASS
eukprot:713-Heterococcus_DN1.PRE.1